MSFENYKTKDSVVVVYTGEGKGKTSASLGLMDRALGNDWSVAYIQFIKTWEVSEHKFIEKISPIFKDQLLFYKGGKGFYNAGNLSAKEVSDKEHRDAARVTFNVALQCVTNGKYDLVICDEINNAVHDGLLTSTQLKKLIQSRTTTTSLCLTGRNFPNDLIDLADIVSDITKLKHHFDNNYLANKGIDF